MKQTMLRWQLCGFAVTSIAGTLLHFLYDWSGRARWIAPFSAVNESTWEHMKLLFFPLFAFAVLQRFFLSDVERFWCIKCKGILLGLVWIPLLFYTYNGAVGPSPDWLNISIFFIAAAIAYLYEARQFQKSSAPVKCGRAAFSLLCFLAFLFVFFTLFPPKIGLFQDPLNGSYGIG